MHTVGTYLGAQKSLEGDLVISFAIDEDPSDLEKLAKLEDQEVVLDVVKFYEKRSLNANAYFWKLCDLIAKKLGSDKDTIYLMMLKNAGAFDTYELPLEAANQIKRLYRYSEEDYRFERYMWNADEDQGRTIDFTCIRCYRGSHEYDKKQMSDLINYTVNEAHDLGIDTWTKEEIKNLIERWDGR